VVERNLALMDLEREEFDYLGAYDTTYAELAGVLPLLGVASLKLPDREGDDVVALVTDKALDLGHKVVVVTEDKDMLQLVGPSVSVYRPTSDERVDEGSFSDCVGIEVTPDEYLLMRAIEGDKSDNIAGVSGVGRKTALALVEKAPRPASPEVLLETARAQDGARNKKVVESWDVVERNLALMDLEREEFSST
jgi:DNA polymerase-1